MMYVAALSVCLAGPNQVALEWPKTASRPREHKPLGCLTLETNSLQEILKARILI